MAKKHNRRTRRSNPAQQSRRSQQSQPGRSVRKRFLNTPSLIFIGLIVLVVGIVAVSSLFSGDDPTCPPGQVWSDAHAHCH